MLTVLTTNAQLNVNWNITLPEVSESNPIQYTWLDASNNTHVVSADNSDLHFSHFGVNTSGEILSNPTLIYPDSLRILDFRGYACDENEKLYFSTLAETAPFDYEEAIICYSPDLEAEWKFTIPDTNALIRNSVHLIQDTLIFFTTSATGHNCWLMDTAGTLLDHTYTHTNDYYYFPDFTTHTDNAFFLSRVYADSVIIHLHADNGVHIAEQQILLSDIHSCYPITAAPDEENGIFLGIYGYDENDSLVQTVLHTTGTEPVLWQQSMSIDHNTLLSLLHDAFYLDANGKLVEIIVTQLTDETVHVLLCHFNVDGTMQYSNSWLVNTWFDPELSATSTFFAEHDRIYVYFARMQSPEYAGSFSVQTDGTVLRMDTLMLAYSPVSGQSFAFAQGDNTLLLVNAKQDACLSPLKGWTNCKKQFSQSNFRFYVQNKTTIQS